MNKQRTVIYASRNSALAISDLKENVLGILKENINLKVAEFFSAEMKEDWDINALGEYLDDYYGYEIEDEKEYLRNTKEEYAEIIYQNLVKKYDEKENEIGASFMRKLEKYILFEVVDNRWREHLKTLDGLRESIYLRAYGQRDPVVEYKLISGEIFEKMIKTIQEQVTSFLYKVVVKESDSNEKMQENESTITPVEENKKSENPDAEDLCPCGSGKKYEKCCGR